MDYSTLSDEQLKQMYQQEQLNTPDYSSMSDEELMALYSNQNPQKVIQGGIKKDEYIGKDGFQVVDTPDSGGLFPSTPMSLPARIKYTKEFFNSPNVKKDLKRSADFARNASYFALPEAKGGALVNGLYQGGVIGASESLANKGLTPSIIGDTAKGAAIGLIGGGVVKGLGKVGNAVKNSGLEVLEKVTGKTRGMYNHLTSPDTRALELGMQPTEAGVVSPIQQYGMDIIKPLRQKAQAVQRLRGMTVGSAKKEAFNRLGDTPIFNNNIITSHIDDYLTNKSQYAKAPNALENEIINLKDRLSQGEALTPKEAQGILDELDDLINYKPSAGMNLSRQDKAIQNVAKQARYSLSKEMDNAFGINYKNAKKSYSEIQKFATPKGINDLNGVPDTTENLISNLFRKDVPESQLLSGLKNISGVTKGEQTQQLIELNNLLKQNGYNEDVLNKIDDFIMADKYANSFNQGGGFMSIVPNIIRQTEKPVLGAVKNLRSLPNIDYSLLKINPSPLYISPAVRSVQGR